MRRLLLPVVALVILTTACSDDPAVDTGNCDSLFGSPGENTGLDTSTCRPERVCEGVDDFAPPVYDEGVLAALRDSTVQSGPRLLPGDPYGDPTLVPSDTSGVCAVQGSMDGYQLLTFDDRAQAESAGATVTHTGACGACSTLQDLAVYLAIPDLGTPVRECALIELGQNPQATQDCILGLGFTMPCAQIWIYNSLHTRQSCLTECLEALNEPSHLPDGSLNACLACDEAESGPVFKAVSGRTRRNSGIPSAICRPGDDVAAVRHDAYP